MPADRHEVHAAATPRQRGVIPKSTGFGKFMQILARQNCIGTGAQTVRARGVLACRDHTKVI